ncbi:MAG: hypothetical protein HUK22_02315 [Thermoguttaceae bacterium]|nr:hypothetical protein [Thermoguttaceae bacterium]
MAQALKFQDGKRQYVVCTQTSDRLSIAGETLSKTDIFDVMTHTLVSNLTGQDADLWDGVEEDEPEIEDPKERRDAEYRDYIRRKYETRQREEENRRMRFASGAFVDHEDADGVDVGAALKAAFAGADADIADFLRTDEDYGEEYVDDSVEDPAWDEENPWERPKIDEDDDENENEKKED